MSAHALMIVQEAFRKRRESIPDIHCAHARLTSLEEEICDQIHKECIEILDICPDCEVEDGEHAKWCNQTLHISSPKCAFCCEKAIYKGWCRVVDGFIKRRTGLIRRTSVCEDHKDRLSTESGHTKTSDAARGGA